VTGIRSSHDELPDRHRFDGMHSPPRGQESGPRSAAKLLSRAEACGIAANMAKLPGTGAQS